MPVLIVRIPPDYFAHESRPPSRFARQPLALRVLLRVAKNALAIVLILAGTAMLVLPGQGLLTVLTGVLLLEVPGKDRLEQWLVGRRVVRRPINWLRQRAGRQPLRTTPVA